MSLEELLLKMDVSDGCQNVSQLIDIRKCIEGNGSAEKHSSRLISLLMSALKLNDDGSHDEIISEALLTLGDCLNLHIFCQSMERETCVEVGNVLCDLMSHSKCKTIVLRSIWCFSMQKFDSTVLTDHCEPILNALNLAFNTYSSSATINYEALNVLEYLSCVAPNQMGEHCALWWNHVIPKVVHPAVKVRTLATKVLHISYKYLQGNPIVMKSIVQELKSNVIKGIIEKYNQIGESAIIELWAVLVKLVGKILHSGTFLINSILEIIEKLFKSRTEKIRIDAMVAWRVLINNFAMSFDVISNTKRLRLLLQPLKTAIFKTEEGIKEKVHTWWHIVVSLNASLSQHFEMVVVPLIEYCFAIPTDSTSRSVIQTKTDGNADNNCRILLLDLGFQILQLLFKDNVERELNSVFEPLKSPVFCGYKFFSTQSEVVMKSLVIACVSKDDFKPQKRNLLYLWKNIAAFIRAANEEIRTIALNLSSSFLRCIQQILTHRTITDAPFALDLLEISTTLPESILISSAVSFGSSDVLHGTPCIYLLKFLLQDPILNDKNCKKLLPLFKKLVSFDNTLISIQATMHCLESTMPMISDPCIALSLWQITTNQLIDYIVLTHEVNQGDDVDHDFSCIYMTLMLPIKHLIWKDIPLTVKRSIPKTWSCLYDTFARNVSVVRTADNNVYCIEIASKISAFIETKQIGLDQLDDLLDFFSEMTRMLQWKNFNYAGFVVNSESPKSNKNNPNDTRINPLFELFTSLFKTFTTTMERREQFKFIHDHLVVPESIVFKILNQLRIIFDNLKDEAYVKMLIHWTPLISLLFDFCNEVDHVISTPKVIAKLDEVWSRLSARLQSNHKGAYDTAFLESLSPLFEASLDHRSQPIRSYSRKLWCSTFATTYENLVIPPSLTEVMNEVEPLMVVGTIEDTWSKDSFEFGAELTKKSPAAKITLRNLTSIATNTSKRRRSLPIEITPIKRKMEAFNRILKVVISPDSTPMIPFPRPKAKESTAMKIPNEILPLPSFAELGESIEVSDSNEETQIQHVKKDVPVPELIVISSVSEDSTDSLESLNKSSSSSSSASVMSTSTCKRQLKFQQLSGSSQEEKTTLASNVVTEGTLLPMTEELLAEMGLAPLNDETTKEQSLVKQSLERNNEDLYGVFTINDVGNESSEKKVNSDWNSTLESTNTNSCSVILNPCCSFSNVTGQEYIENISSSDKKENDKKTTKKTHKKKKRKHKSKNRHETKLTKEKRPKGVKSTSILKKKKQKKTKQKSSLGESKETTNDTSSESTHSMKESYFTETTDEIHNNNVTTAESDSILTDCSTAAESGESYDSATYLSSKVTTNSDTVHESQPNDPSLLSEASLPRNESPSVDADGTALEIMETDTLESPSMSRVVSGLLSLSSSNEFLSPRSGILKKRKLDATLSPLSPPSSKKHRRVSFADPPVQKETTIEPSDRQRKRKSIDRQLLPTLESSVEVSSASVDVSPGNYFSPVPTELDSVNPICPELINCTVPVETILHKITSSTWTRGLNKLFISKNIHTIGQLSSFTEVDIMKLPLKTPKMKIVKDALQQILKCKEQRNPSLEPIADGPPLADGPFHTEGPSNGDGPSNAEGPPCADGPFRAEEPPNADNCSSPSKEQTVDGVDVAKCPINLIDLSTDDSSPMDDFEAFFSTIDEHFDKLIKESLSSLNHQQVATICQRFFGYVNTVSRAWIDARTRPVNKLANDPN